MMSAWAGQEYGLRWWTELEMVHWQGPLVWAKVVVQLVQGQAGWVLVQAQVLQEGELVMVGKEKLRGQDHNTHCILADMMCKEGGVEDWSKTHSSSLKYTKLTLMNFAHSSKKLNSLTLHLLHRSVQPVNSVKYLEVIFN
jgi:hypothetical protein